MLCGIVHILPPDRLVLFFFLIRTTNYLLFSTSHHIETKFTKSYHRATAAVELFSFFFLSWNLLRNLFASIATVKLLMHTKYMLMCSFNLWKFYDKKIISCYVRKNLITNLVYILSFALDFIFVCNVIFIVHFEFLPSKLFISYFEMLFSRIFLEEFHSGR